MIPALLKEKTFYKSDNDTYIKQLSEEYESISISTTISTDNLNH